MNRRPFGPLRILAGVLWYVLLFAFVLFNGARTTHWPRAWVLLGVLLVTRLAGDVWITRANPDLLAERARGPLQRGQPLSDRVLVPAFMAALAVATWVAAADVWRWHLLPAPAPWLAALGMAVYVAGRWLVSAALHANAFATMVVRHQAERGQAVVDRGPYAVVRHPMYSGVVLATIGLPLWLGSTTGVLAALVPILIMAVRIGVEERFLRRALDGYPAYTARVRYRLVPGVW